MRLHILMVAGASLAISACSAGDAPTEPTQGTEPAAAGAMAAPDAGSATASASASGTTSAAKTAEAATDTCGVEQVKGWLSAEPTADIKAQIAKAAGERTIRYYAEGDAITMDYNEARLNVVLGNNGRIREFRCG